MSRDIEDTPTPAAPQRDANGRFAKGNRGGPGNPYARKCAALRTVLIDAVTAEDIQDIALLLKFQAKAGDLAAIKLLFAYVLGRPPEAPDPDRLDAEEWQLLKETSLPDVEEMRRVPLGLPLETCLILARATTEAQNLRMGQMFLDQMHERDRADAEAQARAGSSEAPPKANGSDGAAPAKHPAADEGPRGRLKSRNTAEAVTRRPAPADDQAADWEELLERLGLDETDPELLELLRATPGRPSRNGANGQGQPSRNGANGQGQPSRNGANGQGQPSRNGTNGHATPRRPRGTA